MNWFKYCKAYKNNVAFEQTNGEDCSYRHLLTRINHHKRFLRRFNDKQLVAINAENCIELISFYLSCLLCRHPVILLDKANSVHNQDLCRRFKVNLSVSIEEGELSTTKGSQFKHRFHHSLALMLTTSGSTGSPKLVKLSVKNLLANAQSICEYLNLDSSDKSLCHLNFSYSYGMSIVHSHLLAGATCVLLNSALQIAELANIIQRHKITNFSGVPVHFQQLVKFIEALGSCHSLRFLTQAGGKLEPDLVKLFAQWGKQSDVQFFVMYGQTEASPRISYLPPDLAVMYPQSIGKAIPGGKIYLKKDGKILEKPDQQGELYYQGENVMIGYATSVDCLSLAPQIDELATGDIATFNEHGLYTIVGRVSRIAKLFGKRINLVDIESILAPELEAAVASGDNKLHIFHSQPLLPQQQKKLQLELTKFCGLPSSCFRFSKLAGLPRLTNGKIDYKSLN